MPKYRITLMESGGSMVVLYEEKDNIKVAFDDAITGAEYVFGPADPSKPHTVNVVEEPII